MSEGTRADGRCRKGLADIDRQDGRCHLGLGDKIAMGMNGTCVLVTIIAMDDMNVTRWMT